MMFWVFLALLRVLLKWDSCLEALYGTRALPTSTSDAMGKPALQPALVQRMVHLFIFSELMGVAEPSGRPNMCTLVEGVDAVDVSMFPAFIDESPHIAWAPQMHWMLPRTTRNLARRLYIQCYLVNFRRPWWRLHHIACDIVL